MTFEVREIDAWMEPGPAEEAPGWTWNTSFYIGDMETRAKDPRRALTAYLRRACGITFQRGRTRIEDDGEIIEITDRKTGEPLYAALPRF